MSYSIHLGSLANVRLLGTRYLAKRIRPSIEQILQESEPLELDFTGVEVTQSFLDELLGPLLLREGSSALDHIAFRGCSDSAKAVITFVVSGRLRDFERRGYGPLGAMERLPPS
jgi:hypothetical protein